MEFRTISIFTCLLSSLCFFNMASAFNVKTHTYIGKEVLNDLADGYLDIPPFGKFKVDTALFVAINTNPSAYLLGTMGPDSVPDMLAGQVTAHAGIDGGWFTDDWLKHLSPSSAVPSRENLAWSAFYSGYLSHAASDIFAHTYVNMYAGKEFLLEDEDLLDVEARHFALESYIARFQPYNVSSDDIFGNVGYHYETFDTGERHPPTIAAQEAYTEAALIAFLDQQVEDGVVVNTEYFDFYQFFLERIQSQLPSTDTKRELHSLINWQNSRNLFQRSPVGFHEYVRRINERDYTVLGEIIYEERPVAHETSWDRRFSQVLANALIRNDEVAAQYVLGGSTAYLNKMDEFEERVIEEAKFINVFKDWIKDELSQEIERQTFVEEVIARYEEDAEIETTPTKTKNLNNPLAGVCPFDDPCVEPRDLPKCDTRNTDHITWKSIGGESYEIWLLANCPDAIVSRMERRVVSESVENLFDEYPEFAERAEALGFGHLGSNEAVQTLAVIAAVIVFYQELDYKTLALRYSLAQYHQSAVKDATNKYIFTSVAVAKAVHSGATLEETLQPIKDWVTCYGPVYTSEYNAVLPDVCNLSDSARKLAEAFAQNVSETGEYLAQQSGLAGEALAIKNAYDDFKVRLEALAIDLGKDIVQEVLTEEQKAFISLIREDITDITLNQVYQRDGNGLKLLQIDDMAQRVKVDMHLDDNGFFDSEKFSPVYNAIQLSKLALLDETAINEIEQKAGLSPINYGDFYSGGNFNILFSWIKSLDGNHQWMETSPRYPRQPGHDDLSTDDTRKYSIGSGFNLWNMADYQDKVFEKLFVGPISLSLEDPGSTELEPILPSYYPSRDCVNNPFPQTSDNERCGSVAAWLIPVLYLLGS